MIVSIILHIIFYKLSELLIFVFTQVLYNNALFGQNTKPNQKYKAMCYIWWSHIQNL